MCWFVTFWLRAHSADEAEALARDGAYQLLILAAVADRLSRGVDAAGQRRIRHDPPAPDCGSRVRRMHNAQRGRCQLWRYFGNLTRGPVARRSPALDHVDIAILSALQRNGRSTVQSLADRVGCRHGRA
jgi:AsnC-type helix-turn-helix domain